MNTIQKFRHIHALCFASDERVPTINLSEKKKTYKNVKLLRIHIFAVEVYLNCEYNSHHCAEAFEGFIVKKKEKGRKKGNTY